MEKNSQTLKSLVVAILALIVLWAGFQLFFSVRADVYARKGLKALKAENFDTALKLYTKALKYGSTRIRVLLRLRPDFGRNIQKLPGQGGHVRLYAGGQGSLSTGR